MPVEKYRHPADPMSLWKQYYLATSVEDALHALDSAAGSARVIAGGTDLLLDLQQGRLLPIDTLVDVNGIAEMNSVEIKDGELSIGAAVPLNRLVESELVQQNAMALTEACTLIGGVQVRNVATLGGNVVHGLPAADGSIALLALAAQAEVASRSGYKRLALSDLFLGPGKTIINPQDQILVRFLLPLCRKGQASAFHREMSRQGVALPLLNMALWIERSTQGEREMIADIRLAVGPAGATPFRAEGTEAILRGSGWSEAVLAMAKKALQDEAHFRNSPRRASADYRRMLSSVLLDQVISITWERASR